MEPVLGLEPEPVADPEPISDSDVERAMWEQERDRDIEQRLTTEGRGEAEDSPEEGEAFHGCLFSIKGAPRACQGSRDRWDNPLYFLPAIPTVPEPLRQGGALRVFNVYGCFLCVRWRWVRSPRRPGPINPR